MRRPLFFVLPLCLVLQSPGIAAAATPSPAPKKSPAAKAKGPKRAPADEYFGRQKMSILGVRNSLHDLSIRYDGTVQRAPMVMTVGGDVEEAMRSWSQKYRGDLWLAHEMFRLDEIYMRVPTDEGRKRMNDLTYLIIRDYPDTFYSKYLIKIRKEARQKAALAKIDPSPSQAPTAAASPTRAPAAKPAPEMKPVATRAPTSSPKPSAKPVIVPSPARSTAPVSLQTIAPQPAKTQLPDYLLIPKELIETTPAPK